MNNFFQTQPIGEILQKAHLISPAQIDVALRDQQRYQELNLGNLKLGEILALRGWLKQETTDFFVERWATLLNQKPRQPLGYYLCEAALLSQQQICYLLEEQQKLPVKLRLGELAYLEGWLKPKTIDYFVKNLSAAKSQPTQATTFSLAQEHQIIKQYTNGETNFQQLKLNGIQLKNATLRGINLDRSELEGACLPNINLNYSSLKSVNLVKANLAQASLKKTDLRGANLYRASLKRAFLEAANLQNANLQKTNLKQASLIKASLEGADLREANLKGTLFYGASYDETTRFAPEFNPLQEGMKFTGTNSDSHKILLL